MLCFFPVLVESRISQLHNKNNNSKQASDTIAQPIGEIHRAEAMYGVTMTESLRALSRKVQYCTDAV
jgi:hypothetical protein